MKKLKSNVWIRQSEPKPEPALTQSQDPSSVYCYFTNHGLKAGYVGQKVEGTQDGNYDCLPCPPLPTSLSRDVCDTVEQEIEKERIREQIIKREIEKERIREQIIKREIEKEQIREQIIMSEITNRRTLEDEIRRELMLLEAELARRRKSKALLLGLPPVSYPMELSVTGTIAQRRSIDERIAFYPEEETMSNVVRSESQGLETLPFQWGDGDPKRSEVKPVPITEKGNEDEEKIVLLAKPDTDISGSKRKAVTPPLADTSVCPSDNISNKKAKAVMPPPADTGICPSGSISNKKAKGEWSCDLCQVVAPTESSLSLHLQGKKHKMREASVKSQWARKDYDVGLLPKSPSLQKEIAVDSLLLKKNEDSNMKNKGLSQLPKPNNSKKKQETVQKMQKTGDPKKTNYTYWCEMCQVGGLCEIVKDSHEKGRKHLKRLKRSQNCETGISNKEKKIGVYGTCFQEAVNDWKDAISNVEVNKRDETEEQNVDVIKPGFKMTCDSDSIEDGEIVG